METSFERICTKLFNNTILSLFTLSPHRRLTARFPNGHVEALNSRIILIHIG